MTQRLFFNLNSTCLFSFARRLSLCKSFLHLTTVKCFLHMHWLKADVWQTFTFLLVKSAFLYMKFKQWNTQLDVGSSPGSSRYFFVNTWASHSAKKTTWCIRAGMCTNWNTKIIAALHINCSYRKELSLYLSKSVLMLSIQKNLAGIEDHLVWNLHSPHHHDAIIISVAKRISLHPKILHLAGCPGILQRVGFHL